MTLDAMHCQVETARAIVEAKADYILTVKGNQEGLYHHLLDQFIQYGEADYEVKGMKRHKTVEKSHGRKERREYYVIDAPDSETLQQWPGIRSIGMIYRCRETGEEVQDETMFVISSHEPKVKELAKHIRGHWGIENRQHWVLDVTFAEDQSRIRKGASPEISAAFRRMALNILQRDTTIKENIRGKRLRAGWDERFSTRFTPVFQAINVRLPWRLTTRFGNAPISKRPSSFFCTQRDPENGFRNAALSAWSEV